MDRRIWLGSSSLTLSLALVLSGCRLGLPRQASPEPTPTPVGSVTSRLVAEPTEGAGALPGAYPAPEHPFEPAASAGRGTASAAAAAALVPGRPTLPADLPASGPVAPAVDLEARAAEPFLVAWVDTEGLWLYAEGDAAPRQLLAGQGFRRPQLDPGRRVVIWQRVDPARSDAPELWSLWSMPLDGEPADARQILTPADLPEARGWGGLPCPRWLRDIQWLPDGEAPALAFATSAVGACGGHAQRDLWTMRLGESEPKRLLMTEVAHFRPSPDGRRIAIAEPGDYWAEPPEAAWISVLDVERGELRRLLAYSQYSTESEYWLYPDLLWVDQGQALLVAIEPAELDERYVSGPWQAFEPVPVIRLGLDGSRSRLGSVSPAGLSRFYLDLRLPLFSNGIAVQRVYWSADLSRLALVERAVASSGSARQEAGAQAAEAHPQILLAGGDGSEPEPYARLDDPGFLRWAPTALRFFYADAGPRGWIAGPDELYIGEPGREPRPIYQAQAEGEQLGWAGWAGDAHVVLRREGLPTPPLLELHGLDGGSRGLAQGVGIEVDVLPLGGR